MVVPSVEAPTTDSISTLKIGNGQVITLSFAPVSTLAMVDTAGNVKAVVNRYQPKNKPFFIVGHCWFAFAMFTVGFVVWTSTNRFWIDPSSAR